MEYRYQLAKKGKWICPQCQHKTFVLYVDADNQPLNENVGKCDRADNCAYHYTPHEYFTDNGIPDEQRPKRPAIKPIIQIQPSFIDAAILKATLKQYSENRFATYLHRLFGKEDAAILIHDYFVGSSNHWPGSTVFWQIDRNGHIRAGKIMLYDTDTGKRVKQPFNHISWVHTVLKLDNYNLVQCLFGEHLLKNRPADTVIIVESEKTAIIGAGFATDAVWLATGGCQNLSKKICQPLAGRNVLLMPDNGKFEDWAKRGRDLMGLCKSVYISDIMEQRAVQKGDDIGDLFTECYHNGTLNQSIFDNTTVHRLRN